MIEYSYLDFIKIYSSCYQ